MNADKIMSGQANSCSSGGGAGKSATVEDDIERLATRISAMLEQLEDLGGVSPPVVTSEEEVTLMNAMSLPTNQRVQLTAMIQQLSSMERNVLSDMPSGDETVLITALDRTKREAMDLNACVKIFSGYSCQLQNEVEMSKMMTDEMLHFYKGMLERKEEDEGEGSGEGEGDMARLKATFKQLKQDLKFVLERFLPEEKEKILEVLSLLEEGPYDKDGWVELDAESCDEWWSAVSVLLDCVLIEQHPDVVTKFRSALTEEILA